MSETNVDNKEEIVKPKYDGRIKKRQWEDDDDSESKKTRTEPFERVKRRKYILLLGYSGINYFGMQRCLCFLKS